MTPHHAHDSRDEGVNAASPFDLSVADAFCHRDSVAGVHGIGVSTPKAVAVAAATVGFAIEVQLPNPGMFTAGTESFTFAFRFDGRTIRHPGATPFEQIKIAPLPTKCSAGLTVGFGFPPLEALGVVGTGAACGVKNALTNIGCPGGPTL